MIERKFYIDFGDRRDHALEYLAGILKDARVTTLQRVENLSVKELHWKYREGWNTIGALLAYIAAIEHYFRVEYVEGRKLTEEENECWLPALDMGDQLPKLITGDRSET